MSWLRKLDVLWHFRGSVSLGPSSDNAAVIVRVTKLLKQQRKPLSRRSAASVAFDSPLFSDPFVGSWRALVIYDRGRIWIDETGGSRRLRYDLRSLHGFIFCLGFSCLCVLFGLLGHDPRWGLKTGAFMFAWLYGMNMLLAALRVSGLFQRAVNHT